MAAKPEKTELFISTLGWVTIVISALAFYFCLVNLLFLYFDLNLQIKQFFTLPGFSSLGELATDKMESTRIQANTFSILSFYLAGFLVSGIAVLERRNWGRIFFISLSAISIFIVLAAVIAFLVFGYRQEFVEGLGALNFPQKFRFVAFGVPAVLFAWSLYRLSLRLSLERVIRWFQ